MPSSTEQISILIVEDDQFKLDSVLIFLAEFGNDVSVRTCEALSTAIEILGKQSFDVVILDMSIPSHPVAPGAGSPYSFPSGGLDVLFEIDSEGHQCTSIILTQYPEIEIDGKLIPLTSAAKEIEEKFDIVVAGCIQYFQDSETWKSSIRNILKHL